MFLRNQGEFGTNCAVDKYIRISVKTRWKFVYRPIIKRSNIGR